MALIREAPRGLSSSLNRVRKAFPFNLGLSLSHSLRLPRYRLAVNTSESFIESSMGTLIFSLDFYIYPRFFVNFHITDFLMLIYNSTINFLLCFHGSVLLAEL